MCLARHGRGDCLGSRQVLRAKIFSGGPQVGGQTLGNPRRLFAVAVGGDHDIDANVRSIGVGETVKPANINDPGLFFRRQHDCQACFADTAEGRGGGHQHGQLFHVRHRF